jgi:hypothetical protein
MVSFHTFCFDGPIFKKPIPFVVGEKVYREYNAPADNDPGKDEKLLEKRKWDFGFVICYRKNRRFFQMPVLPFNIPGIVW